MSQAFNLSQFANKVNTSGQADLTTAVTGTLPKGNGGTGLTTPGTSGNVLMSDGTDWVSGTIYPVRNRIINGAMVIDQRNAGASTTPSASNTYNLDRWVTEFSQVSKLTVQQNYGAITPPAGFTNYLGIKVAATATVGSADYFTVEQRIEGFNIADLAWGTASAKTVTLSFWVYSNITGTFGGCIQNIDGSRNYPFQYTISSANTWTTISITIVGDTTGTWAANSARGIVIYFSLGTGTTYSNTANTWTSSASISATGATSLMGSTSNYWYVTGVQLEQGLTATPFERRMYGQELANCMRYYWKVGPTAQMVGTTGYVPGSGVVYRVGYEFPVPMRATPTINFNSVSVWDGTNVVGSLAFSGSGNYTNYQRLDGDYTTAAGLTTGKYAKIYLNSSYIDISAEL
jgi:hypothetical protein